MNTTRQSQPKQAQSDDGFAVIAMLSTLLHRLETSKQAVDATQYRTVVQRLAAVLGEAPLDTRLEALLEAHPASAELYENLRYEHAGLCRAPLERSMATESQARDLLARAARG
ncbi:MAG: hypothetical protein AB7L76_02930 [Burkholderiaceae bacterium]